MTTVSYADLQPGMQVTATTTWTGTGAMSAVTGTVIAVTDNCITLNTGDTAPSPAYADTDTSLTFEHTGGTGDIPEPDPGTILLDEVNAAWQRVGDEWLSINGDRLAWSDLLAAHPTPTLLQDTPPTPLPDPPPAGYPVTIAPDDARLGMDIRVTVTYAAGGSKVVRGICTWNQDNGTNKTDDIPDYLLINLNTGDEFQYNPVPDGQTLLVEQMQDWTADSVWDISGIPEPPAGAVVRSRTGVAWQHTADATTDGPLVDGTGPWYLAGQGMWSSVTGDYSRSFLWLWGAAAPFNIQEPA